MKKGTENSQKEEAPPLPRKKANQSEGFCFAG